MSDSFFIHNCEVLHHNYELKVFTTRVIDKEEGVLLPVMYFKDILFCGGLVTIKSLLHMQLYM